MFVVDDAPLDEWLSALKPYQEKHIRALLDSGRTVEEAADLWVSAKGLDGTIVFGGSRDSKPFLDRFKAEFKKFICGDQAYDEERKKLVGIGSAGKTAVISGISTAIAPHVGASAVLLIPSVALLLHVVGKIGIRAWCAEGSKPS
jgi:hypothetical protein